MNTVTQYYFTLLFTFTAAIKSLQAWHLVNAGLQNGGGEAVTSRPVFYSMFTQCTHYLKQHAVKVKPTHLHKLL